MNLSQDTRLAPPQGLRNGCGPHTSPTKCFVGNSSATGKSIGIKNNAKPYSNRNNNDNYAVHVEHSRMQQQQQHDHHNSQIQEMFEKCFLYQKYATANNWCLPSAQELFKEYYQLESLQELKIKLNLVKSKLNDYVIEDWSLHTRRQDPAGEIPWRLKTETNAEFVTIAWCKMYECLGRFPELIKGPQVNSLHLCEAPGAFITALNHYMYTNYDKNEVQWKWLATTLNPYYEGNPVNRMIMDDRFLLYTLDNWLFHKDFTGNIIDTDNLQHMQQECAKRLGDVHLITADGSVDCIESPDCQEEKVALLHYAEIITALTILAEGGSFVIKMFTLYEASSVSKLFLLNCAFEKVHVFKPCTSKRGNSEVYVICLNYKKEAKHLSEIIEQMKLKLTPQNALLWPLFAKTSLPLDFLRQHEICCRIFMNHQINAIEQNIYSYEIRPHKMIVKRLQNLRTATCNEFYQRYNIQKLPDELKILYKYQKFIEKSYKNQIYKGSHSEREMFKETSKEEHIFKFRKHLNDLEKMLKEHLHSSEIKYKFEHLEELEESQVKLSLYRGQGVRVLNSSLFANVHLLIMRSKLNDLYSETSCDSLWLQEPRATYTCDETVVEIKFNDFANISGNFAMQQELFFKKLISSLLAAKPNEVKFINMPFLTHYAVSILRYLSTLSYKHLSFAFETDFEITLSASCGDFINSLEELKVALSSSLDQDILCFINILLLHRNDFNKTLCAFNNMLLLKNFKYLLHN
ncbi:Cap-specific mRNA (nucleoside-2'-O-)-methyltransferase 2 [Lucilia cuprina]|uniref:Cap-specific mRNA (nucleoside-2'-O-)-methyltransferase 2 n=1 Tax=Lucilia cuprina TaxID=7375 RepID=A0A0L0BPS5_LUCCU|nr:Cap-specific mRNA (nucleoside-2'-O-)-methyltransferase 2 [Lucilia cuprina]